MLGIYTPTPQPTTPLLLAFPRAIRKSLEKAGEARFAALEEDKAEQKELAEGGGLGELRLGVLRGHEQSEHAEAHALPVDRTQHGERSAHGLGALQRPESSCQRPGPGAVGKRVMVDGVYSRNFARCAKHRHPSADGKATRITRLLHNGL